MVERQFKEAGLITHYFTKIGVVIVELSDTLSVGDKILVQGSNTSFEQTVESMQIEHKNVSTAQKGQSIGLKLKQRAREGDKVYRII